MLPVKLALPPYTAVIECLPTVSVDVVSVALPLLSVFVPNTVVPSLNVTDPVGVTVAVWVDKTQAENSDVFPFGSVAVAVIRFPTVPVLADLTVAVKVTAVPCVEGFNEEVTVVVLAAGRVTRNEALQLLLVVTLAAPRKVCPSPNPEGSHMALEKNSIRKVVLAVLLSVPCTVVLSPLLVAVVRTG